MSMQTDSAADREYDLLLEEACMKVALQLDELAAGQDRKNLGFDVMINMLGATIVHCSPDPLGRLEDVVLALREAVFRNYGPAGTA